MILSASAKEFQKINGNYVQVLQNNGKLLGLTPGGRLYQCQNPTIDGEWLELKGTPKETPFQSISSSTQALWAIDTQGFAWWTRIDSAQNQKFQKANSGDDNVLKFEHISAGENETWAVTENDELYRRCDPYNCVGKDMNSQKVCEKVCDGIWKKVNFSARYVSVGDEYVYVIGKAKKAYISRFPCESPVSWKEIPSTNIFIKF